MGGEARCWKASKARPQSLVFILWVLKGDGAKGVTETVLHENLSAVLREWVREGGGGEALAEPGGGDPSWDDSKCFRWRQQGPDPSLHP